MFKEDLKNKPLVNLKLTPSGPKVNPNWTRIFKTLNQSKPQVNPKSKPTIKVVVFSGVRLGLNGTVLLKIYKIQKHKAPKNKQNKTKKD